MSFPQNPGSPSPSHLEPRADPGCRKKFKTPRQFKSHLDTVHKDPVRYQCPQCFRFLTSLHGLAAHIENPRAKCGVRRSREYGHLVSQLSCGLVELNRDFVLQEDRGFDDESYVDGSTAYGANSGSKRPAEFIMSSMGQKPKPAKLTPENLERVDELAHAVDQGLNFTEKTDEQLENERDMEENNGFW